MSDATLHAPTGEVLDPVSRERRFWFVVLVVGFSMISATGLTLLVGLGIVTHGLILVTAMIDGLNTTSMILSLGYVGGSVIDYNGALSKAMAARHPKSSL